MKNKLFNILLCIFLLNSINIFSLDNDIKEIEPIESIYSDENSSVSVENNEKTISENSYQENYKSKNSNIISTNKDLKTNKKEAGTYVLAFFLLYKVQACSSLITRKSKDYNLISTELFLQTFYFLG